MIQNKKFLLKNTLLFLFPLLIPLFVLGSFAIVITDKYMKESITSNNFNSLQQLEQQTNIVLNEMHLLNLDYNWNPDIILSLQDILDSNYLTSNQNQKLQYQEGTLRRKEIVTPYIHSIYVFYSNTKNRVLTSQTGVTTIDSMNDQAWLDEFDPTSKKSDIWIKNRNVAHFPFENPEPLITIFKNVFKTNAPTSEGLIVLNIHQNYFEDLINEWNNYHNQSIFVLDDQNNKLYGNKNSEKLHVENWDLTSDKQTFEIKMDHKTYIVNQLHSDNYNLRYYSIVEKNIIYWIPNQLRLLTIIFVFLSFILGIAIIYYLSKKNAQHISDIIAILNITSPKKESLTNNISFKDNEYQFIVRGILKNYINQNNLEKELNEKKYQLQSAELSALHNQINPHFLSNTLAIIYWRAMALTGKPNKVTEMLGTLTDILNFSLRIKSHTVTLKEEIENAKNYIDIMRIRSQSDFHIYWKYKQTDLDQQVLKFILQPILENFLQHGIHDGSTSKIRVKIERKNSRIRFRITDNGQGMSKHSLQQLHAELDKDEYVTNHIGLANIKKRLSLVFNNHYIFIIRSKKGWGTTIFIEHPCE
ncbi:histidine kinase [Lederbergia sp. NSJ-179]|uniref:sensor histidine kinase n=1 Tax=Lederbergia sp. NSJ-179 TaxID=2931402 RepID=UPI001FD43ACD|nr:histidine kinase [Lederbergia sp. NSJ-179]MCJ7843243.1 histidine kinase [Lederbergia sp. NSJ-179]